MAADWLPTVASLAGVNLPHDVKAGLMGRDASALFLPRKRSSGASGHSSGIDDKQLVGVPPPRKIPVMLDYRFDPAGTLRIGCATVCCCCCVSVH